MSSDLFKYMFNIFHRVWVSVCEMLSNFAMIVLHRKTWKECNLTDLIDFLWFYGILNIIFHILNFFLFLSQQIILKKI